MGFAIWLRKLKQAICNNLEEWDGEGDGREFQKGGNICIPMADSEEPVGIHSGGLQRVGLD